MGTIYGISQTKMSYYRKLNDIGKSFVLATLLNGLGWLFALVSFNRYAVKAGRQVASLYVSLERGDSRERFRLLSGLIERKAKMFTVHRFVGQNWDLFSETERAVFLKLFIQAREYDFTGYYFSPWEVVSAENRYFKFALFLIDLFPEKKEQRSVWRQDVWRLIRGIDGVLQSRINKGQTALTPGSLFSALIDLAPRDVGTQLFQFYCDYQQYLRKLKAAQFHDI